MSLVLKGINKFVVRVHCKPFFVQCFFAFSKYMGVSIDEAVSDHYVLGNGLCGSLPIMVIKVMKQLFLTKPLTDF